MLFRSKRQLAGIVYLPEIDWHQITLIDLGTMLPLSQFSTILVVYILTLFSALILFNFALNRLVLNPLSQLDLAMEQIEAGKNPSRLIEQKGRGEIARLISRFIKMSRAVLESRQNLEQKVQKRTAALEMLAKVDPLTNLYNRRGMTERMTTRINRAHREHSRIGLLWLDIDWFKEVNDTHGHAVGDEALKTVAKIIQTTIRSYDLAARWGGDEFLVLLQPADDHALAWLGERIRVAVAKHGESEDKLTLSVSIGGSLSMEGQKIDLLLHNADKALYEAKAAGRNRFHAYKNP